MIDLTPERHTIQHQLVLAGRLKIDARILEGSDVAETLITFARANRVAQILVMRHKDARLPSLFRRGLVQRIVGLAPDMHVTIVADRSSRRPIG